MDDNNKRLPSLTWVYAVVCVLALGLFGVGVYLAVQGMGWAMLAAGSASIVAVLAAWPLSWSLYASRCADEQYQTQLLTTITDRLEQVSIMLNLISEQQLLSDRAKAVAFREKDRDAIRRAIQEEILAGDWEAAMALANDIETSFGYKQEAERVRQEIQAKHDEINRKHVNDHMAVIDRLTRGEQWQEARREAERIMPLFPNDEQVRNLPQEIENRRMAHKKRLLDAYNDAVARHDIDGGIEILKQLDIYLTTQEAENMQDSARGVFKEKLNSLRTQFSIAVQDHKWAEAVRVGEIVVAEFPNTRLAQEVKEKMDALRQRAGEPGEVAATR